MEAGRRTIGNARASDVPETVLKDTIVDDMFFGVSALSSEGTESIVTFGGRALRRQ